MFFFTLTHDAARMRCITYQVLILDSVRYRCVRVGRVLVYSTLQDTVYGYNPGPPQAACTAHIYECWALRPSSVYTQSGSNYDTHLIQR